MVQIVWVFVLALPGGRARGERRPAGIPVPRPPAGGSGTAGILPVVGEKAMKLNPSLGRTMAELGQQAVLGPVEVQARLLADLQVAEALQQAREAIAAAKDDELQMRREASVGSAQKAIAHLERVHAGYHAPSLVTHAQATLALALMLRPADIEGASQAFRQALAVDPGYAPTTGQIPPRAAQLLQQEREQQPQVTAPGVASLSWLAGRLKLARLVWLRTSRSGEGKIKVQILLYDHRRAQVTRRLSGEVESDRALVETARLVSQALGGIRVRARRRDPAPPPVRPWYRRWWVWTIAGAFVAAGVGVGVGLALRPESRSGYDFHFHF